METIIYILLQVLTQLGNSFSAAIADTDSSVASKSKVDDVSIIYYVQNRLFLFIFIDNRTCIIVVDAKEILRRSICASQLYGSHSEIDVEG